MIQGIYGIRCLANGRVYVGQSQNIERRWRGHKRELQRRVHYNPHFQNAWNKHGADNFTFFVCEEVFQKEHLVERETYWCEHFKAGEGIFNCQTPGRPGRGNEMRPWNKGEHHTEKTKQKISESIKQYYATPEGKAQIVKQRNRLRSEEARRKHSESLRAYYESPTGKAMLASRPSHLLGDHLAAVRASASPLTQEDVLAIRERYAEGGITQLTLAAIYGVHSRTIHNIVRYKTWKNDLISTPTLRAISSVWKEHLFYAQRVER